MQAELAGGSLHLVVGTHALVEDPVGFRELGLVDHRRAASVRRPAARVAAREGAAPGRARDDRDADPADARADDLRRPRCLDHARDAARPACRSRRSRSRSRAAKRSTNSSARRWTRDARPTSSIRWSKNQRRWTCVPRPRWRTISRRTSFPHYRVALLHGRMKQDAKDRVMQAFARGEYHILVSTTVVEVGVDVANASVMLVEHAERFGLSQLHQLRGRVGRGPHQSFCVLLYQEPLTDQGRERLKALTDTTDGFVIAERDLELRGPGDFFGTRQSGLPTLRVGDIVRDHQLMEEARREAGAALDDPAQHEPAGRRSSARAGRSGSGWWASAERRCGSLPGTLEGAAPRGAGLAGAAADVGPAARNALQHPRAADRGRAGPGRVRRHRRGRHRSAQPGSGARDLRRAGSARAGADRSQPRAVWGRRTAMLLSARDLQPRRSGRRRVRCDRFSIRRTAQRNSTDALESGGAARRAGDAADRRARNAGRRARSRPDGSSARGNWCTATARWRSIASIER